MNIKLMDMYFNKKKNIIFIKRQLKNYRIKIGQSKKKSLKEILKYQIEWKKYNKYNNIYLYGIEFVGIGETIPRLFMYLRDSELRDKKSYHIVLPIFFENYDAGIFNNAIFTIFKAHIHFITKKNIDFWQYVFLLHSNKLILKYFDKYRFRKEKVIPVKRDVPLISFNKKMESYGRRKLREMGICKEFICFHAREVETKKTNFNSSYPDTSVTDVDINSFDLAYEYLKKLGFQAVRMGKDEKKKCEIKGVIDYTNYFYDEFMDFYLISNCKFLIGCASGLTTITGYWGKPVLLTNLNAFCYGFESWPSVNDCLYIPKKFYSDYDGKFLSLYEMFDVSNRCDRYNEYFEKEGIRVIDNTSEEIYYATLEMNEKMDHTWKYTEEEVKCMEKYWKILNLWKSRHKTSLPRKRQGAKGYQMPFMPISYTFLKNNTYLLEVDESVWGN